MFPKKRKNRIGDFDALKISLASPDKILDWSFGEVTKAETINYRTFKSEPDGLFCEKIFGPTTNYECYCGKYKKIRYKGIVCDKCGVEVTTKDVRRERMGHIELAVPATHVWFAYGIPNKLSIILDMPHKKLLSVIYYSRFMVTEMDESKKPDIEDKIQEIKKAAEVDLDKQLKEAIAELEKKQKEEIKKIKKEKKDNDGELDFELSKLEHKHNQEIAKLRHEYATYQAEEDEFYLGLIELIKDINVGSVLTEDQYLDLQERDLLFFEAEMGAEAIEKLLEQVDLKKEIDALRMESRNARGQKKVKLIRRLQYLEGLEKNRIDPRWMILKVIPVLPPDLRPIIPLSGGKFATHDLNDLYRRIINRNNRLKRLIEIGAPEIILRNEKRMLQESVDALIDNQHRPSKPMLNSKRLPYSSLTDQLRGKKGIFRKNLLGKRVDYSGRAVIVGDAKLQLHQCGLPKSVTLEIFKPFVIHELLDRELAPNIKIAREIIENGEEVVWDVLEEIIENKPVILNRAPTLHKYSIQTFYPKLVEGEAIHLHPLVCKAYNADFDGDQMAVHVLLTDEAIEEGIDKMMSPKNIISIANGKILANPSKDMLLGYFLLTDLDDVEKPKFYGTGNEAIKAYHREKIGMNEKIVVKISGEVTETSVGRIIFNSVLPDGYEFVNKRIGGAEIGEILEDVSNRYSREILLELLDTLKTIGFKYATDLGFTFAMEDCQVDIDMQRRIKEMEEKDSQLEENYSQGLITESEKVNLSVNMWNDFADEAAEEAWDKLDENNSVYEMVQSKANGGKIQMRQVITIKGVVRDSQGNWIPLPIKGNYRDGLSGFEYFVAANGGRKGQVDQSLRTSSAGYLTRKLVDVAHAVIIRQEDCGYDGKGIPIKRDSDRRLSYEDRLYGRVVTENVKNEKGDVIVEANEAITREKAEIIAASDIISVNVRTPLFCKSPLGICQKCYGWNIESGNMIEMGTAVGVIAAQSIGEPGTQLTMRTFHKGGVEKTDITQGLPRVEELLEARTPKTEAEIAKFDGKAHVEKQDDDSHTIIITGKKKVEKNYVVSYAKKVLVKDGTKVKNGDPIFIDQEENEKQAPYAGEIKLDHGVLTVVGNVEAEEVITVLPGVTLLVGDGDAVEAGQQLTEGSVDPKKLADNAGIAKAQEYIIDEVQKVFNEQGVALADVHFEVVVRQMARLARVLDPGDSDYLVGTLINRFIADVKNEIIREDDKNICLFVPRLLGIKASALYTESFLSAMSFQEQVRVLTNASLIGKVDYLRGMKENVIIGKRIPVGESARIDDITELDEVKMS